MVLHNLAIDSYTLHLSNKIHKINNECMDQHISIYPPTGMVCYKDVCD